MFLIFSKFEPHKRKTISYFVLIGPRLKTEGIYKIPSVPPSVRPFVRPSVRPG